LRIDCKNERETATDIRDGSGAEHWQLKDPAAWVENVERFYRAYDAEAV